MLLLALVACGGGAPDPWGVSDFVADEGAYAELAAPGEPQGELLMLRVDEGWELRRGAAWLGGDEVARFEVQTHAGLQVGGEALLPGSLAQGATADGATISAIGEFTTWYGTFPEVVVVERADGRFAGTQAFARHVGPVFLTLDGAGWELVYYE